MATRAVEPSASASGEGSSAQRTSLEREPSSYVRARSPGGEARARRRVAEYLRALGSTSEPRVDALAREIVSASVATGDDSPEAAVALAQQRVASWRSAVFGEAAEAVHPLWLRTFLMTHPQVLLGDVAEARALARAFGDPLAGSAPVRARFQDQSLTPARIPSWVRGLVPPLALTLGATALLIYGLAQDGFGLAELAFALLFAFLFGLSAAGFCTALYGFLYRHRKSPLALVRPDETIPRSALVMPVYHENAERVFAAIAAMRESLAATPGGEAFEIFVLSDSREAANAAAEERAFRRIAAAGDERIPVYYRRRTRNDRYKAGNLAEFFERFGNRYTYAVVLDADSLMRGETIVELVRRMQANPRLALLQAPLALHRGQTLFARAQQLAGAVCGPIFTRGLALWAGPHGNYYGHNAAVRVQAFLDCCALPLLSGQPPLGGQLLSHDFVEAALLCRAGYEVRMADDLGGSFEELPATLPEYVARDRRWCQGNLQHLRVLRAEGLQPMSRLHMLMGACAYLVGIVWLAFMVLAVGLAYARPGVALVPAAVAVPLILATAVCLLGPKLLGLLATWKQARNGFGGGLRLLASVVFETGLAAFLGPLLLVHHARGVLSILAGTAVRWEARKRNAPGAPSTIARAELPSTLLGFMLLGWSLTAAPQLLLWLAPLYVPFICAIPLALAASSERAGALAARLGLLTVPSESCPDDVALRAEELRALTLGDEAARFRDLVLDPVLLAAHIERLGNAAAKPVAPEVLARLRERAVRVGPAALSKEERATLAADPESMRFLHREAWRSWPVESWQLGRDRPQLPEDC